MRAFAKSTIMAVAIGVLGVGAMSAIAAPAAKLTKAQALAIALKIAPGKVKDAEYEKEGAGWRYSFDIVQGNRIHEIGIDANTGKVVENKYEGLNSKD